MVIKIIILQIMLVVLNKILKLLIHIYQKVIKNGVETKGSTVHQDLSRNSMMLDIKTMKFLKKIKGMFNNKREMKKCMIELNRT